MSYKLLGRTDAGQKIQLDPASLTSWEKFDNTVPASTTKVIESVVLSSFHSVDYILTIYNEVEEKTRRLQMTVVREGVTISTSVYGRLGSMTGISVNGNVNAANLDLEIVNDNGYQVNVSYTRLTL